MPEASNEVQVPENCFGLRLTYGLGHGDENFVAPYALLRGLYAGTEYTGKAAALRPCYTHPE